MPTAKKRLISIKSLLLLSVIIVSYNVKYFLEQCLYAVFAATQKLETEVIVVDNNSPDKSVAYLRNIFPTVAFIENSQNTGYARANNQGLGHAKGSYILFLNPDTLVTETALTKAVAALAQEAANGALGIRMLDGGGHFLPESKRGIPSPQTAFYKLSGLIRLFPASPTIGRYYMGWLPEKENAAVEILSGAFMMIKKEVLIKTGGFDEQFFMYGEDIDLSYRILQAGYRNIYLGECAIVHFKGESTNKDTRYIRMFYKAMDIFVKKHYGHRSTLFALAMRSAIAAGTAFSSFQQRFGQKKALTENPLRIAVIGAQTDLQLSHDLLDAYAATGKTWATHHTVKALMVDSNEQVPDEIIFCIGELSYEQAFECMEQFAQRAIVFKFFKAGSRNMVSSSKKTASGEVFVSSGERDRLAGQV